MNKAVTPSEMPAGRPVPAISLRSVFLIASSLLAGGCASTTEVKVDSLAKPKAEEAVSYQIHNGNPLLAEDSLRYKEAADYVKTALSGRGMYEAPPGAKADVIVDLDFGISEPQQRREIVQDPVFRIEPGVMVERTIIAVDPVTKRAIPVVVKEYTGDRQVVDHFEERQVTVTVYEKYLRLSARENAVAAEGRPPAEIWTVDVTSEGESRDLRKNLPILAAASIDYVGKDTHGQKVVKIKDKGSDVSFVKNSAQTNNGSQTNNGPQPN